MRPLEAPGAAVVVDASVFIAGLMADGRARHVLLHTDLLLYAPPRVLDEVHAREETIADRAGLSVGVVSTVLDAFDERIEIAPGAWVDAFAAEAEDRARAADARGDEDYIALALALDAPVWTYDQDFARVEGLELIGTSDVEDGHLPERP